MLKNGCITIDEYKATIENGEVTTVEKGSCASTETSNFGGQVITDIPETGHTGVKAIVYLDPTNLSTECNAELAAANVNVYEVDGNTYKSPTGIKSGCMKWYAFTDENGYYTMLLDHNTTATTVPWTTQEDYEQTGSQITTPSELGITYASTNIVNGLPTGTWYYAGGTNNRGPITLLNQLKIDTSNWVVAETLSDSNSYTAEWTCTNSANQSAYCDGYYSGNQKYTINYDGYKARVLSAEEVNEITGKGTNTLSNVVDSYIDTKCSSSGTCALGTNAYAWLFDYTGTNVPVGTTGAPDCTQYGCNAGNNFDVTGYWTMSPSASRYDHAWFVCFNGQLGSYYAGNSTYGVRPVIKVSKDKFGINS